MNRTASQTQSTAIETERPVWKCDVCGDELVDDDGVIVISYADINRHEEEMAAWEAEHPRDASGNRIVSGTELQTHPRHVPWHVVHDRCGGEDRHAPPYAIAVSRIDTWRKVASWTAHLHGDKRWFAATAWDALLRRAGAGQS